MLEVAGGDVSRIVGVLKNSVGVPLQGKGLGVGRKAQSCQLSGIQLLRVF